MHFFHANLWRRHVLVTPSSMLNQLVVCECITVLIVSTAYSQSVDPSCGLPILLEKALCYGLEHRNAPVTVCRLGHHISLSPSMAICAPPFTVPTGRETLA